MNVLIVLFLNPKDQLIYPKKKFYYQKIEIPLTKKKTKKNFLFILKKIIITCFFQRNSFFLISHA